MVAVLSAMAVGGCGGQETSNHDTTLGLGATTTTRTTPARAPDHNGRAPSPPSARPTPAARPSATAIQSGPNGRKVVALTFDADMTPGMLKRIAAGTAPEQVDRALLTTLRQTRTPATLFLTGMWARRYPAETRALASDPQFELGDHTFDHRAWTGPAACYGLSGVAGTTAKLGEIDQTEAAIRTAAGRGTKWFRFPGLCHDPGDVRIVAGRGLQVVDGLASGDAFQHDSGAIVAKVMGELRPGAIIVCHMMGAPNVPATAAAVADLVPRIRAQGYRFVTLSGLLGPRG